MTDAVGRVATAVVLGAGSDIAAATLRRLARGGLRGAVLAARDPGRIGIAGELSAAGVDVRLARFDAAETDAHEALVTDAFAELGDVDLVLVCAGVLGDGDALDHDEVVTAFRTNALGIASVVSVAAARMIEQGHGVIAVLSSVAGRRARRVNAAYGGSKAGIDGYCEALGDALHGTGVRVMVVRPGFVRTKMTRGRPEAPMATDAERVAAAIVRGIATGAETVWVPGAIRAVAAILRVLPRPLFRRLSR